MKILGIIPARYASSRFPGKPLVDIRGKSMIRRVFEQAKKSRKLSDVVVATDDQRIYDEINSFGGRATMTSPDHKNGTERCAEVAEKLSADFFINIQGDEPYIHPQQIDDLALLLDQKTELGTLVKQIKDQVLLEKDSVMKVVLDVEGNAIYFSRQCIPYVRDLPKNKWLDHQVFWKHIGIYAYRSDILKEIVKLPPGNLEQAESLEQLRWLENGYKIRVAKTEFESVSIDTPQDLALLNQKIEDGKIS